MRAFRSGLRGNLRFAAGWSQCRGRRLVSGRRGEVVDHSAYFQ